jgi:hypothetical protein
MEKEISDFCGEIFNRVFFGPFGVFDFENAVLARIKLT